MDDLGMGFWLKLAGIFVAGAIILFILTLLLLHAVYAWGLFGALLVLAALALLMGWLYDRRHPSHSGSSF
jgi:hypothetical protein